MQKSQYIQKILKKFILNKCNEFETEEVIAYLQKSKKSNNIPTVEEVLALLDEKPELLEIDANRIYNNIFQKIKPEEKKYPKKPRFIWRYAAAAIIIGILTSSYFFKSDIFKNLPDINLKTANKTIKAGKNKAILTLSNGVDIALEKGNSYQTKHVVSNGENLVYDKKKLSLEDVSYHYLTIPRGGAFHVVLSDSTEIWLNSESQLKYPVHFTEGLTREVELVYGEAYFKVSPSTKHLGAKFKVINQFQNVEVLGTQFNIKAYKDEEHIYTTLVEGKVSVNTTTKQILKPSQQSKFNIIANTMIINEVDTYNETSWKDGVFSFRRKPLVEIMKVLSRWYDIDVHFANPELKNIGFNGVLGKEQNIEDILETIKVFGIIESYKIVNKTIYLK